MRKMLAIFLVLGPACGGPAEDPNGSAEPVTLADQLSKATVTAPAPDMVLVRAVSLRGDDQPAIFMHPPAQVEFPPVKLGKEPALLCAVGLNDEVADKPGDGVDFRVSVKLPEGGVVEVWSRYLDTRKNKTDRGWQPARISLEKFAGQTVRVVLSTSVGTAGNSQYDWAFWGRPMLVSGSK